MRRAAMGSQTMLSSSGGNSGSAHSPFSSLTRQPSIYSLTLEELQNAMNEPAKNLGSMNMDEFLKNIWTAEESQAMAAAMASGSSAADARPVPLARQPSLPHQNNLSLPRTLSKKTVDEVWKEIQRNPEANLQEKQQRRQGTLGEMTLEDFLVRAGVVRDDADAAQVADANGGMPAYSPITGVGISNMHPSSMENLSVPGLQADWMNYASRQHQQQLLQQAEAAAAFAAAKRGAPSPSLMLPGNTIYDQMPDGAGLGPGSLASGLALSPVVPDYSMHGKKRGAAEAVIEKTVERRQRRMIKNRESAARSRARKQAYTVELEAEVTLLKEENARLKKQQDFERHILPGSRNLQTRVLRRTRSW